MSLRVYAVCIREMRVPCVGCPEQYDEFMPCGLFVAESAGHAKSLAFNTWVSQMKSGVYSDDYVNLRARVIDWEAGWEDGEFWWALPIGEVIGTGPYETMLWDNWPKEYVAR